MLIHVESARLQQYQKQNKETMITIVKVHYSDVMMVSENYCAFFRSSTQKCDSCHHSAWFMAQENRQNRLHLRHTPDKIYQPIFNETCFWHLVLFHKDVAKTLSTRRCEIGHWQNNRPTPTFCGTLSPVILAHQRSTFNICVCDRKFEFLSKRPLVIQHK